MAGAIQETNTEKLHQELESLQNRLSCEGYTYFTKYTKIILHPIFKTSFPKILQVPIL